METCSFGRQPSPDLISRGMKMRDFLGSELWLKGPKWLSQPENSWPATKMIVSPQVGLEINRECREISELEYNYEYHSV